MMSHKTEYDYAAARPRGKRTVTKVLLFLMLIATVVLVIVLCIYTSLNYNQIKTINNNNLKGFASPATVTCQSNVDIASLQAILQNSFDARYLKDTDSSIVRGVDKGGASIPGYTPVFDFTNTSHAFRSTTPNGYSFQANSVNFPALSNQAFSQTLFQLEPNGCNSPHHHPAALEILHVFQGTIEVVRIEPDGGNVFRETIGENMTVVFPRGHVHFQHNVGPGIARYISNLNSELPGVMTEAQRTCALPYDALLSAFSLPSAQLIWQLCGSGGTPGLPENIILYLTAMFPTMQTATGIGSLFKPNKVVDDVHSK